MVKIRLKRIGKKKTPFYKIIVSDSKFPVDGRFIEQIGTYDPNTNPGTVKVDEELAKKWLSNGAQPTDTVSKLVRTGRQTVKELVEVIAKALVDHPEEVQVEEERKDDVVVFALHVAPSDMGKVIGKQGRIAKAIRAVVKAASTRENLKVDVDIR